MLRLSARHRACRRILRLCSGRILQSSGEAPVPLLNAGYPSVYDCGVIALSTDARPAPEKVEVFVDGRSVLVDPGTTVLQVIAYRVFSRVNRQTLLVGFLGLCYGWH